tara:strand:+ start:304 stop:1257 length:954 start_codon:yes stop_codon:yes gene_type:complete
MNSKFYTKEQILKTLKNIDLLESIEKGFVEYSRGNSVVPPVGELLFDQPPGDVHIKYGYIKNEDNYVVKIASGFSENDKVGLSSSHGVMVMFDSKTGYLKCVLHDEGYLTNVRTAIAGAICAKYLASKQIDGIGIVGTGIQARMQLEYLKLVTDCREVFILGRNKEKISKYIEVMKSHGFNINIVSDSKELCKNSNLIVTTTNANESLIYKDDIKEGTHITAMGSDTPDKRELDPRILNIADTVIVDSIPQCLERGETKNALDRNLIKKEDLIEIGSIIDSGEKLRKNNNEITVADLTGVAVQDIMITNAVYEQLIK